MIKRSQLLLGLRGSHTLVEGARCVGVHACVGSASERESYIPTLLVSQTKYWFGSVSRCLCGKANHSGTETRRLFTFQNNIEHTCLEHLSIHTALFDRDRILNPVHRIVLFRVALKMNLRD